MISYGKVRSAFAWAFPLFLGSLYIVGAHLISFDRFQHLLAAKNEKRKEQAEIISTRVKAEYSAALQIEKSFREILKTLSAITENNDSAIEKRLPELLKEKFHPEILKNCRLWAFNKEGSEFRLITAPGLENSKKKAMELAFAALLNLQEKHADDSARRRSEKFIAGLFGANSAPEYLSAQRQGILTPAHFEGSPCYIYWQKINDRMNYTGGIIALFPGAFVEDTRSSLSRLARELAHEYKNDLFISFPESPLVSNSFRPLSVNDQQSADSVKASMSSLEKLFADNDFPRRQFIKRAGWTHYIDLISQDTHFFSAISFKENEPQRFGKGLLPALTVFLLVWSATFFLRLRHQGFSLSLAFKTLFFMTGMLPVFLFFYLGYSLIEQSKEAEIKQKIKSAFSGIELLDEKSEESVGLAGVLIKEKLSDPFFHKAFTSDDQAVQRSGFEKLQQDLRKRSFFLNYVLLIPPGRQASFHVSSHSDLPYAKYHLDYYIISAGDLNKVLTARNSRFPQISLNKTQKTLVNSLGGEDNPSIKDVFLSSLERINSFQSGTVARHVFFTTVLGNRNQIGCYLVLAISIDETVREVIRTELQALNSDQETSFFCYGRNLSAGFNSVAPESRITSGETGRNFLRFLQASMHHQFRIKQEFNQSVFIYEPMNKVKRYLGGAIIDLSRTARTADFKLTVLILIVAILAASIYLLAAAVSKLLIQPAGELNLVFNRIASGDLSCSFSYPYANELGELSKGTTQMIRGLKERKLLGKFVSTTFDSDLKERNQNELAQTISGTVLFSDIRSFTTISESYPPEVIAGLLNTHLREMVEIIHHNSGRIEQFIGDAIVAFFPGEKAASIAKALHAANSMMVQHQRIQNKREKAAQPTYAIGIGLDFGQVMAGVLRSGKRSEFSVIGPARSRAEACEAASKNGVATRIMMTDDVAECVCKSDVEMIKHSQDLFELKELKSL